MSNVVLRNLGPDYRRSSGRVVRRGELFEATHVEVEKMGKRHQLGIRFMIMSEGQPTRDSETGTPPGSADSQPTPPEGQGAAATPEGADPAQQTSGTLTGRLPATGDWPNVAAPPREAIVKPRAPKPRKPKPGDTEPPKPKRARAK